MARRVVRARFRVARARLKLIPIARALGVSQATVSNWLASGRWQNGVPKRRSTRCWYAWLFVAQPCRDLHGDYATVFPVDLQAFPASDALQALGDDLAVGLVRKCGDAPVAKARMLLAQGNDLLSSQSGDVWELDELWGIVGSKACQLWRWVLLLPQNPPGRGLDTWRQPSCKVRRTCAPSCPGIIAVCDTCSDPWRRLRRRVSKCHPALPGERGRVSC